MSNIHFKNTSTNIENCTSASSNLSSSEKGLSYLPNLSQENVLNSQQLQEDIIHKIFSEKEEEIKNRYFSNGEIFSNLSKDVKIQIFTDFMSSFTTFIMQYAVNYYRLSTSE